MNKIILGLILTGLTHLEAHTAPNVAAYLDGSHFGYTTFLALTADGAVWGAQHFHDYTNFIPLCGENFGGVADISPGTVKQVPGLRNVVDVSGQNALKEDGTVWTWQYMVYTRKSGSIGGFGSNLIGLPLKAEQIPDLSDIVQIAANAQSTFGFALKNDGSVWRWLPKMPVYDPQKPCFFLKKGVAPAEKIIGIDQVVSLKTNRDAVLALKSDGSVWTWKQYEATPKRIQNLENVTAIFANQLDAYALKTDGSLFGWGENLGVVHKDGRSATPVAIPVFGNDVKQILVGDNHLGAVKRDGSVWALGGSQSGTICPEGDDPCPGPSTEFPGTPIFFAPVKLRGVGNDFLSISAGLYNFTLVKPDGAIYIIGGAIVKYGI